MSLEHPSPDAIRAPNKLMNPTTIPNLNTHPDQFPSLRYPPHLPTQSHNHISSAPETRLYSAQASATNINDLTDPSIPDWNLFDAAVLSMGKTSGLDQGLIDPSSAREVSGDFSLSEKEDSFQTLFHNNFDMWGALEDQREGAEGMRF